MKLSIDDPKLTAFALGEIHGVEAEEIRLFVEANEDAKKYVEEVQATAQFLQAEFAQEQVAGLSRSKLAKLHDLGTVKVGTVKKIFNPKRIGAFSTLAAASLALVWGLRFHDENKIEVVLTITPQMMAEAEKIKRPEFDDSAISRPSSRSGEHDPNRIGYFSAFGSKGRAEAEPGVIKKRKAGGSGYAYDKYWPLGNSLQENFAKNVSDEPLSTFSLDVDTAAYSRLRSYVMSGQDPSQYDLHLEELINYFKYDYASPQAGQPLAATVEIAQTPWNKETKLLRIAVKAKDVVPEDRPAANLVFLIDSSASMMPDNKLALVKKSLYLLVDELRPQDRVALVVYADGAGVYLNSTSGQEKTKIKAAIAAMKPEGYTDGSAGINLAYKIARQNFMEKGINRVILASDGAFNVGIYATQELEALITEKAKSGVFLNVLGFGMNSYDAEILQTLANKGNGQYNFVDNLREGKKYLVEQAAGTLQTVAKDVKAQVEFDPEFVSKYRLIGYEKGKLQNEDFRNDAKDAGDIGAGHTVTVFYEITLNKKVEEQAQLGSVKLRFKKPQENTVETLELPIANEGKSFAEASSDFQFAASVVAFGQVLRNSVYKRTLDFDQVLKLATKNTKLHGKEDSHRTEFIEIVKKAKKLQKNNRPFSYFGKGR